MKKVAGCGGLVAALLALSLPAFVNAESSVEAATASSGEPVSVGDAKRGRMLFMQCQACHTLEKQGEHRMGPNLHGVISRDAGTAEGFNYSKAMAGSGITWNAQTLDRFITRPNEFLPGTTMVFVGVSKPKDRADIIAWIAEHQD